MYALFVSGMRSGGRELTRGCLECDQGKPKKNLRITSKKGGSAVSGEAKGRGDLLNRLLLTDLETEAQHLATNVYYISVMTCVYDFFKPPPSHSFQTWSSCRLSVFERGIPSHLSMTPQLCKCHCC